MANEPMDASKAEADSAFLEFDSAKSEAVDARGTPPVDARERMWRAVKLYAWLATLICAVWGLWLLTAWVYKYPPRPADPLTDACMKLKKGMTEDEACAVVRLTANTEYGLCRGGSVPCAPAEYPLRTDSDERALDAKMLCWSWHEQGNIMISGERWTSLYLFFDNGVLCHAYCEYDYVSHRETVQKLMSE